MCIKHPRYKGLRRPRTTCPFCYEDYTMMSPLCPPCPDWVREWVGDQMAGCREAGINATCPSSDYYDWYQTQPCPYGLDIGNYYHHGLLGEKTCEYKKCKLECKPSNKYLEDRGTYPCLNVLPQYIPENSI